MERPGFTTGTYIGSSSSPGGSDSSSSSEHGYISLLVLALIYSNLYLWILFSIPSFLNLNFPGKYLRFTFGINPLKSNDLVYLSASFVSFLIFKLVEGLYF